MTSPNLRPLHRSGTVRRVVAIALAATTLGVTGAVAVALAQDDSARETCSATATDLRVAADAVRRLEVQRPDIFRQSPRPADHDDLRLAAEWADRMAELDPDGRAYCTR